jgi:hypothetical protein
LRRVTLVIVPTESSSYNMETSANDCGCQHWNIDWNE